MTPHDRLLIERFLDTAEKLAGRFDSLNSAHKRQAITWLRALLNSNEIETPKK